ncbi:MAG: ABC transporter substrate-binding protein [Campylobacteraceae bacterium]|jgi:phospholipid transport system substrate-binding protein|nr:ABC transporter substrate-binding protein [Campylobacteraceae bacterium]
MALKIIFTLIFVCSFAFGITQNEIDTKLKADLDAVVKMLQDSDSDIDQKSQKIFAIFEGVFDFEQMAKNCLGKAQWSALNENQQKEFIDKFVKRLKESYADKLKFYTNQKIDLEKSVQTSATRIQLLMFLLDSDGKRYDVLYKFYDTKQDKGWLIYDVDILGVSITQTYRSQFEGALKNGSFEDLIKKIESIEINTTQQ